jgi:hypothetical protein
MPTFEYKRIYHSRLLPRRQIRFSANFPPCAMTPRETREHAMRCRKSNAFFGPVGSYFCDQTLRLHADQNPAYATAKLKAVQGTALFLPPWFFGAQLLSPPGHDPTISLSQGLDKIKYGLPAFSSDANLSRVVFKTRSLVGIPGQYLSAVGTPYSKKHPDSLVKECSALGGLLLFQRI